jgi:tripartite-type tricarboxylate transporter receptor subunit TctC
MFRHVRNFALFALAAASLLGAGNAQGAFPERPITLIVPWAAGGGTDAVARQIAHMLERDLKQPVNVVNRTGGSGVVGHQAIATAAPDGYTFGLITLEINLMHWAGLTDLTWEKYTPIALVNQDPAAIHVKADSPYRNVKELFAHIKANPNKVVASGTGQGGSWHVALAGLMQADGVSPNSIRWVPSTGAATALTDLAAGGVDFVACSMPEAEALLKAGVSAASCSSHPTARRTSLMCRLPRRRRVTSGTRVCGAALRHPRACRRRLPRNTRPRSSRSGTARSS